MIILKLLRKIIKYTLIFFISCIFVWLLFSCHLQKKQSEVLKNNSENSKTDELQFAFLYVDACSARMKGNLQEALTMFKECKRINPISAPVSYELANIYKLLGNNKEALPHAKYCADFDLKNEWYQLLAIDCLNGQKQFGQALKLRQALVKNFPNKIEFKEDLAIQFALIGQYDNAYKIYDELETNLGVSDHVTINKIKLLKSQNKAKEAEIELLKLSQTNLNEVKYYGYLADFYLDIDKPEKAKQMYDKMLLLEPNNPHVNLALYDYYNSIGKENEAFDCLIKAFQNTEIEANTKTDILSSYYKKAEESLQADFINQGLRLAKIILTIHPKLAEPNLFIANFLMLKDSLSEAAFYFYEAANLDKRNYSTWDKLLLTDYKLAKFDSLEHHSAIAIDLFPTLASTYFFNGIANNQLKNYLKAAKSLNEGIEFVYDNKSLKIDFYSNLGDAYHYLKEYSNSDKAFEEALKINSDNTYVLNNFAYYLSLRNEKLLIAEKYSNRANELMPNDRNYMDTFGWILYQQKKYTEAEIWLSKSSEMGIKNPTILEHYGDVLYKLNKNEEALKKWIESKQAGNNAEGLEKKIKEKKLND